MRNYEYFESAKHPGRIKAWIKGVPVEAAAIEQTRNVARMPFIHSHVALMPDVHVGYGATVGSVIATNKAIIPSAVGVDIGCGMMAVPTNLTAADLPDNLGPMRSAIEAAVPHGRSNNGKPGDKGAWDEVPVVVQKCFASVATRGLTTILGKHPKVIKQDSGRDRARSQLGTLGTGNHFIEVCLDLDDRVWVMLHSGSRGIGNAIGQYFINLAKEDMRTWFINLPDADLAYLAEGTEHFADYCSAVGWAQDYALLNRKIMMDSTINAMRLTLGRPVLVPKKCEAVNCHHNYISKENHFGANVWVTRKGAVRARKGDLGIIPGSMGARSFIVEGLGNPDSFNSCSHGAGRVMSRTEARRTFSLADHLHDTEGVECRKDAEVIDETPKAYKDIDAVMAAQSDLVKIKATLKQILCVKG